MRPDDRALVQRHFTHELSELEAARLERLLEKDEAATALFLALAEQDHRAKGLPLPAAARRPWKLWALAASLLLALGYAWSLRLPRPAGQPIPAAAQVPLEAGPAQPYQAELVLPRPAALLVVVLDAHGQVLRRMSLGLQARGRVRIGWDGKDAEGRSAPPGDYDLLVRPSDGSPTQTLPVHVR